MRPITFTLMAVALVGLVSGSVLVELHAQSAKPRPAAEPTMPSAAAQAGRAKAAPGAAATAAQGPIVNLNTASLAELEALPGIGAKTAARIIDYRQKKGQFKKIEELMNVQGIGEKSFLKLKPRITVGNGQ